MEDCWAESRQFLDAGPSMIQILFKDMSTGKLTVVELGKRHLNTPQTHGEAQGKEYDADKLDL